MIKTAPAVHYLLTLINDMMTTPYPFHPVIMFPTSLYPLCIIALPVVVLIITDSLYKQSQHASTPMFLAISAPLCLSPPFLCTAYKVRISSHLFSECLSRYNAWTLKQPFKKPKSPLIMGDFQYPVSHRCYMVSLNLSTLPL